MPRFQYFSFLFLNFFVQNILINNYPQVHGPGLWWAISFPMQQSAKWGVFPMNRWNVDRSKTFIIGWVWGQAKGWWFAFFFVTQWNITTGKGFYNVFFWVWSGMDIYNRPIKKKQTNKQNKNKRKRNWAMNNNCMICAGLCGVKYILPTTRTKT